MRKHKRRNQKKWFRIVAQNIHQGKQISHFHAQRIVESVQLFADSQYHNVFRPWWYEQLESNSKLDLLTEHKRHFKEVEQKLIEMTGITSEEFNQIAISLKRTTSRKPRKSKEKPKQPVRKLRKAEEFEIRMMKGDFQTVTGEKVFTVGTHDFFIYRTEGRHFDFWTVSDVDTGTKIYSHERYKEAVRKAKEIITKHYDSYVTQVAKIKEGKS
ncbi:hypothetical protein MKX34_11650 [Paenibacillus sp. FSL R5-0636]|uniref:hypothetical protein n=1 Tax=Paenibacillus TaxID=44249 RepID=UPI00097003DD|nr:hypothetical protein [Paenibacillus odorifer]OMD04713.1 hypothetical protein BJP49_22860 [Paenibacillus odorifer]